MSAISGVSFQKAIAIVAEDGGWNEFPPQVILTGLTKADVDGKMRSLSEYISISGLHLSTIYATTHERFLSQFIVEVE